MSTDYAPVVKEVVKEALAPRFGRHSVKVKQDKKATDPWVDVFIYIDVPSDCFCHRLDRAGRCDSCLEALDQSEAHAIYLVKEAMSRNSLKFSTYADYEGNTHERFSLLVSFKGI